MPKKKQDSKEIEMMLAEIARHSDTEEPTVLQEKPKDFMPEVPEEDFEEPDEVGNTPEEALCVEEYINLPPDTKDIKFARSGELVDLKVLRENLYLQEKKSYVTLMLVGLIFFAMGVL
ncbi:hypothetical protein DRN76_03030 [Methanosarcinales archaeon]|nr:MAG: hypothetical protein DRN76_03030 [Methanosarcinales archaeon]